MVDMGMKMTQGERLARIETLLIARDEADKKEAEVMTGVLNEMRDDIKAIRGELDADKADLAALKNKGAGIMIGVGLFGSAIGAVVATLWDRIVSGLFH